MQQVGVAFRNGALPTEHRCKEEAKTQKEQQLSSTWERTGNLLITFANCKNWAKIRNYFAVVEGRQVSKVTCGITTGAIRLPALAFPFKNCISWLWSISMRNASLSPRSLLVGILGSVCPTNAFAGVTTSVATLTQVTVRIGGLFRRTLTYNIRNYELNWMHLMNETKSIP